MTSPYIRNATHVEREKSCGKRRRFRIARRQRQQDGSLQRCAGRSIASKLRPSHSKALLTKNQVEGF
jgi:hypothetical protein